MSICLRRRAGSAELAKATNAAHAPAQTNTMTVMVGMGRPWPGGGKIVSDSGSRTPYRRELHARELLLAVLDAVRVEIADRHDIGLVVFPDARQVVATRDPADSDGAYVDSIARRGLSEDA